jgi:trehalose/maltose hydrolase-like predicted phosphorylase
MNGEECHNEWEITFEEIHRNGAIAFAIYNFYQIQETTVTFLKKIRSTWYCSFLASKSEFSLI